jgi:hypothetical protein
MATDDSLQSAQQRLRDYVFAELLKTHKSNVAQEVIERLTKIQDQFKNLEHRLDQRPTNEQCGPTQQETWASWQAGSQYSSADSDDGKRTKRTGGDRHRKSPRSLSNWYHALLIILVFVNTVTLCLLVFRSADEPPAPPSEAAGRGQTESPGRTGPGDNSGETLESAAAQGWEILQSQPIGTLLCGGTAPPCPRPTDQGQTSRALELAVNELHRRFTCASGTAGATPCAGASASSQSKMLDAALAMIAWDDNEQATPGNGGG